MLQTQSEDRRTASDARLPPGGKEDAGKKRQGLNWSFAASAEANPEEQRQAR